jgi:hypothetical protein
VCEEHTDMKRYHRIYRCKQVVYSERLHALSFLQALKPGQKQKAPCRVAAAWHSPHHHHLQRNKNAARPRPGPQEANRRQRA